MESDKVGFLHRPENEDSGDEPVEPDCFARAFHRYFPEIRPRKQSFINSIDTRIFSMGTCFAAEINKHLGKLGFQTYFQIESCQHFSADTIASVLEFAAGLRKHGKSDLLSLDDGRALPFRYNIWNRAFLGSGGTKTALDYVQALNEDLLNALKVSELLIFTLGTARVIRINETNDIVARASLIPRDQWHSYLMSVDEVCECIKRILNAVKVVFPKGAPPIVFTLSPQRYLFTTGDFSEDPFADNCLNKATLRVAIDRIIREEKNFNLSYFPSYEIVIDELRLQDSLLNFDQGHVSIYTPPYVLRRFLATFASDSTIKTVNAADKLNDFIEEQLPRLDIGIPRTEKRLLDELEKIMDNLEVVLPHMGRSLSGKFLFLVQNYFGSDAVSQLPEVPDHILARYRSLAERSVQILDKFKEIDESL